MKQQQQQQQEEEEEKRGYHGYDMGADHAEHLPFPVKGDHPFLLSWTSFGGIKRLGPISSFVAHPVVMLCFLSTLLEP